MPYFAFVRTMKFRLTFEFLIFRDFDPTWNHEMDWGFNCSGLTHSFDLRFSRFFCSFLKMDEKKSFGIIAIELIYSWTFCNLLCFWSCVAETWNVAFQPQFHSAYPNVVWIQHLWQLWPNLEPSCFFRMFYVKTKQVFASEVSCELLKRLREWRIKNLATLQISLSLFQKPNLAKLAFCHCSGMLCDELWFIWSFLRKWQKGRKYLDAKNLSLSPEYFCFVFNPGSECADANLHQPVQSFNHT